MWKKLKSTLIILLCVAVFAVIGCRSLMDGITPAKIDARSSEYAGVEEKQFGFGSLADAEYIKKEIIIRHRDGQLNLRRVAQDDKLKYQDALGFIDANIEEARVLQGFIIGSEDNPISLLGLLAPIGLAGIAGKMFLKRPGDYTPQDFDTAVAAIKAENNNQA